MVTIRRTRRRPARATTITTRTRGGTKRITTRRTARITTRTRARKDENK